RNQRSLVVRPWSATGHERRVRARFRPRLTCRTPTPASASSLRPRSAMRNRRDIVIGQLWLADIRQLSGGNHADDYTRRPEELTRCFLNVSRSDRERSSDLLRIRLRVMCPHLALRQSISPRRSGLQGSDCRYAVEVRECLQFRGPNWSCRQIRDDAIDDAFDPTEGRTGTCRDIDDEHSFGLEIVQFRVNERRERFFAHKRLGQTAESAETILIAAHDAGERVQRHLLRTRETNRSPRKAKSARVGARALNDQASLTAKLGRRRQATRSDLRARNWLEVPPKKASNRVRREVAAYRDNGVVWAIVLRTKVDHCLQPRRVEIREWSERWRVQRIILWKNGLARNVDRLAKRHVVDPQGSLLADDRTNRIEMLRVNARERSGHPSRFKSQHSLELVARYRFVVLRILRRSGRPRPTASA